MKNIPNMITSVRLLSAIIIALVSCIAPDHGVHYFLPLFIAAAASDMLDGYVARRFGWCTKFGATLDSISDLALYFSASVYFAYTAPEALMKSFLPICVGAIIQALHIGFALKKFGRFPAYHTNFSRLSAYAIFFLVLSFLLFHVSDSFSFISVIWTTCSLEGIWITAILKRPASDLSGITDAIRTLQTSV